MNNLEPSGCRVHPCTRWVQDFILWRVHCTRFTRAIYAYAFWCICSEVHMYLPSLLFILLALIFDLGWLIQCINDKYASGLRGTSDAKQRLISTLSTQTYSISLKGGSYTTSKLFLLSTYNDCLCLITDINSIVCRCTSLVIKWSPYTKSEDRQYFYPPILIATYTSIFLISIFSHF